MASVSIDSPTKRFPSELNRTFDIIAFDWDGTAVPNRHADATLATALIDQLLQAGVYVVAVTGTNINNMFGQSLKHINGEQKSRLFACCNRGSEIFGFDTGSGEPILRWGRQATEEEMKKMDVVSERMKSLLETEYGLKIDIVYDRLNRRKIDINTYPEWADPPKARIAELEAATTKVLQDAGFEGGMGRLFEICRTIAKEEGLPDARLTTDMKYLEVGLTDKGDSTRWLNSELAQPLGIEARNILIGGDEYGPLGGAPGSDYLMVIPELENSVYVSVGIEPNGVVPPVIGLGGGPAAFCDILSDQIRRHDGHSSK